MSQRTQLTEFSLDSRDGSKREEAFEFGRMGKSSIFWGGLWRAIPEKGRCNAAIARRHFEGHFIGPIEAVKKIS
jgi:hypothetical protein